MKKLSVEGKELLLKDLCARLPYETIYANITWEDGIVRNKTFINTGVISDLICDKIKSIKPYLRPMSSMTEEEKKEYGKVCELDTEMLANHPMNGEPFPALYNSQDWLNKKMFAYRTIDGKDMFELGLALKAPEGMYNVKEK